MSLPLCFTVIYMRLSGKARELGYALTLHGSLNRDLDLVAVPWTDSAVSAEELAQAMITESGGFIAPHEGDELPRKKPHGRLCWSIHLGAGPYIDLSVVERNLDSAA